jgi:flagellar basal body-associated protein FliL
MFLIDELQKNSELTKDRRREIIGIIAVAIAFVVLGIAVIFGFMYINDTSQAAISSQAAVCNEYFRTLANITQNQQQSFLGDVLNLPGG